MQSILFISPVYPNPYGSGREKRAHQWVNKLSDSFAVEILVITQEVQVKPAPTEYNLRVINTSYTSTDRRWQFTNLLMGQRRSAPVFGWETIQASHKAKLSAWYHDKAYSKILCFRLYLSDYALYLQKISKTSVIELDLDDIESQTVGKITALLFKNRMYKEALKQMISARFYKYCEARYLPCYSKVYCCSTEDEQFINSKYMPVATAVFPNRIPGTPQPVRECKEKVILFVGTLGYYPNSDAAKWFVLHVLPLLQAKSNDWKLNVVGYQIPDKLKLLLEQTGGACYKGEVNSIGEAYEQASIVVAPLRAGGGTKLKVLEAMWYGRPVVATHEAVHGLGLIPGVHYLAAESAVEFFDRIEQLSQDRELYIKLVAAALDVVSQKYSYAISAAVSK